MWCMWQISGMIIKPFENVMQWLLLHFVPHTFHWATTFTKRFFQTTSRLVDRLMPVSIVFTVLTVNTDLRILLFYILNISQSKSTSSMGNTGIMSSTSKISNTNSFTYFTSFQAHLWVNFRAIFKGNFETLLSRRNDIIHQKGLYQKGLFEHYFQKGRWEEGGW